VLKEVINRLHTGDGEPLFLIEDTDGHPSRDKTRTRALNGSRHNGYDESQAAIRPDHDRAGKMGGHPCMRGMRITVRRVLEILATYPDRLELFKDYPDLQEEDLQQALAFAAAAVDGTIDLHLDAA
jgi:uncharacterized protein (DUF433 family)